MKPGTVKSLLPLLRPICGACSKLVGGELALTQVHVHHHIHCHHNQNYHHHHHYHQGVLRGLSQLARSGPVHIDWQEGAVSHTHHHNYGDYVLHNHRCHHLQNCHHHRHYHHY